MKGMKQRLFVDMDGTLAVFRPVDHLEALYEEGYFYNLPPQMEVVEAVRMLAKSGNYEVYIMSSVLSDSHFALAEKNLWLDRYLPEIDVGHRIFPPCGENKLEYVPDGVRESDCLLDDYSKNLHEWEPPAKGIKLMNGINGTRGTWAGEKVQHDVLPEQMAARLMMIMERLSPEKLPKPEPKMRTPRL